MRFLAVLLGIEAAILWDLAHQPLTPLGLLCWALALYSLGWILYSLRELATRPRNRRDRIDRYR
jgi:hypothetical protein